jgi:hypothetical protein
VSDDFLSRWSRRKIAVRKGERPEEAPKAPAGAEPAPGAGREAPTAGAVPEPSATLPPVASLTIESDFSPFMKADVDPGLRRQALKVLLRDPRFNVMDGLDVYIDVYSKPDPLPPEWLDQLKQLKHMGHYVEAGDGAGEAGKAAESSAAEEPARLQKAMPEQAVETPAPDTVEVRNPDPPVAESEESGK